MVKDLRTNVEKGNAQGVLDGDLDDFIEAALLPVLAINDRVLHFSQALEFLRISSCQKKPLATTLSSPACQTAMLCQIVSVHLSKSRQFDLLCSEGFY